MHATCRVASLLFARRRFFDVVPRSDQKYYLFLILRGARTKTVESGASRNYEPWKSEETANELKERERKEAEEGDEMKKLENKTKASKREMDLNAALEEMKSLSARHGRMDLDGRRRERREDGRERTREKRVRGGDASEEDVRDGGERE